MPLKVGQHRPASETPLKWRFAGVPIMANHCMLPWGLCDFRGSVSILLGNPLFWGFFRGLGPPAPPFGSTHEFTGSICVFQIDLIGNDAEVHPYIRLCTSSYYSYFAWTIYIMEGTLLAFGAFLAFETRKVKSLELITGKAI